MQWKDVIDSSENASAVITGVIRSVYDERDYNAEHIFEKQHHHHKKRLDNHKKQKHSYSNEHVNSHHLHSHPHHKHLAGSALAAAHQKKHGENAGEGDNIFLTPYVAEKLPPVWNCFDQEDTTTIAKNDVYDQGMTDECVSYSLCELGEFQLYHERPEYKTKGIRLSTKRLYSLRANAPAPGMSLKNGCEIVCKKGFVEHSIYEQHIDIDKELYRLNKELQEAKKAVDNFRLVKNSSNYAGNVMREQLNQRYNNLEVQKRAKEKELGQIIININKIDEAAKSHKHCYARVNTVETLKKSIFFNGPCPSILPFYRRCNGVQFWLPDPNHPEKQGELGHCIDFVGWDDNKQAFLIRNSWGKKYNNQFKYPGHVYFPYEHITKQIPWETFTIFYDGAAHLQYVQEKIQYRIAGNNDQTILPPTEKLEILQDENLEEDKQTYEQLEEKDSEEASKEDFEEESIEFSSDSDDDNENQPIGQIMDGFTAPLHTHIYTAPTTTESILPTLSKIEEIKTAGHSANIPIVESVSKNKKSKTSTSSSKSKKNPKNKKKNVDTPQSLLNSACNYVLFFVPCCH